MYEEGKLYSHFQIVTMILLFSEPYLIGPVKGHILYCVLFLRPSAMSQLPLKLNWQEKSANGSTSLLDHTGVCKLLYIVSQG